MAQFTVLRSRVVPLPVNDVDTDQILPARFLKATDKVGLGRLLFADWRFRQDGQPNADFVLNRPGYEGAQILLAGDNFGCGSSRDLVPWALVDHGFRAIVSTSFADIFRGNALKNGLIPVVVPVDVHRELFALVAATPELEVGIDLAAQTLALPNGTKVTFPIDAFSKACLLKGTDELGYLQSFEAAISRYEDAS